MKPMTAGGMVSGEKRSAITKAACAAIAERWKMPSDKYPIKALLTEAGVSRPSAIQYLGPRKLAQWEYERSMAIAERDRNRRKKDA
jgi:hypothetical protein